MDSPSTLEHPLHCLSAFKAAPSARYRAARRDAAAAFHFQRREADARAVVGPDTDLACHSVPTPRPPVLPSRRLPPSQDTGSTHSLLVLDPGKSGAIRALIPGKWVSHWPFFCLVFIMHMPVLGELYPGKVGVIKIIIKKCCYEK